MGRNFDDYPGFQPFRSWANTYAQDCMYQSKYSCQVLGRDIKKKLAVIGAYGVQYAHPLGMNRDAQ